MRINLILGDSTLILPGLPSASFDCIATDPPYSPGGASPVSRKRPPAGKIQDGDARKAYQPFLGASRDQRSQFAWMTLWLSEAWRIARPNGILLLFTDWRMLPLSSDAVQAGGWTWRSTLVWDKTEGARPNKGYFRHQAEFILFGTKGGWTAPTPMTYPGVYRHAVRPSEKNHVTGKPVALARELLAPLAPGSDVLDPFMGGGSILRAAVLAGHSVTGIELEPASFVAAEALVRGGRALTVTGGAQGAAMMTSGNLNGKVKSFL
jgi:site-specific DNA-methyltransferase (adenine-specific)